MKKLRMTIDEMLYVKEKINLLDTAIQCGRPDGMSKVTWKLLKKQLKHMKGYDDALSERVANALNKHMNKSKYAPERDIDTVQTGGYTPRPTPPGKE